METILSISQTFSTVGNYLISILAFLSLLLGLVGIRDLMGSKPVSNGLAIFLLSSIVAIFFIGFLWICWFHYQIYHHISLELSEQLVAWLNRQLQLVNNKSGYALPLYNPLHPPRYAIPVWIENEKYYFWFFCYAVMALVSHVRLKHQGFRCVLSLLLAVQVGILVLLTNPFAEPLPRFFEQINLWFSQEGSGMERIGLFMRLYPKMIFYYNAEYMWLHPPLLFIAYGCITITFITSTFMFWRRDASLEFMGYDFAKLGYFMLTLGMLLGYPWALKAWGPNWWWDPKICSSIMMWAIYSTYLHTRLYANKVSMWYFTSILGVLCFLAMIFTFVSSFYFPGEHTFQ